MELNRVAADSSVSRGTSPFDKIASSPDGGSATPSVIHSVASPWHLEAEMKSTQGAASSCEFARPGPAVCCWQQPFASGVLLATVFVSPNTAVSDNPWPRAQASFCSVEKQQH